MSDILAELEARRAAARADAAQVLAPEQELGMPRAS